MDEQREEALQLLSPEELEQVGGGFYGDGQLI